MRTFILTSLLLLTGVAPSAGQALQATPGNDTEAYLDRHAPLRITLNRALTPEDGRIAVLLGTTDVSALLVQSGTQLLYQPSSLPLPRGETNVVVYRVSDEGAWQEIGRWRIRVLTRGGLERALLDPGLTLSNKGQLAEETDPRPEPLADHRIYQDFSGQLDLLTELVRRGWTLSGSSQVVGVSYRNEALRFAELADEAPRIDLASYRLEVGSGPAQVRLGHVSHGRHRHLISGFGTRGIAASVTAGTRADLSVAAMSGTRVVGWRNPSGLNEPDHRLVSTTLGFDALRIAGSGVRLEGSYLAGSVLPQTGFNQGGIPDAAKSRGGGLRLVAHTANSRVRLEAGYAGSRYESPPDPSLAQGATLVPVQPETRYAHYLEATLGVLQNLKVTERLPLSLQSVYRRERVDPLYQTVAAYLQSDRLHNSVEVQANLGAASAQFAYGRSKNNLDAIPSILTSRTRQTSVGVGVPPGAYLRVTTGLWSRLVPTLSYAYSGTHQRAAGIPVDGGFSLTHLPDQMNRIHNASASWQGTRWSFGYRMSASFQDNRQEGRETADFLNQTHSVSLSVTPISAVILSVDFSSDRAESRESDRIDRTRRLGARTTLRPWRRLTLVAALAPTVSRDDAGMSRTGRSTMSLEGSYAFEYARPGRWPMRGQIFVRYARNTTAFRSTEAQIDTRTAVWSVNSGITLSIF